MSSTTRILMALCLAAFAAACAPQEEEIVYVAPVTTEPTNTGKYK